MATCHEQTNPGSTYSWHEISTSYCVVIRNTRFVHFGFYCVTELPALTRPSKPVISGPRYCCALSVFASYLRGFPISIRNAHVWFWWCNLGLSEWVPEMGHELVVITCHIHVYPLRVVCQDLANSWSDLDPISGGFWSGFAVYKIMHNL